MAVKVTLEFDSVDHAIVALSKLTGVRVKAVAPKIEPAAAGAQPPAPKPERKARDDKGQPRGPYRPRQSEANPAGAGNRERVGEAHALDTSAAPAGAAAEPKAEAGTSPSSASVSVVDGSAGGAATSPATSPAVAPTGAASAPAPAVDLAAEAQAALKVLFDGKGMEVATQLLSRYGAQRLRDLKPEHLAPFAQYAKLIAALPQKIGTPEFLTAVNAIYAA